MYRRTFIFSFLLVSIVFFAISSHYDISSLTEKDYSIKSVNVNCNGPDTINITIQDSIKIISVKLVWRKNSNPWDSVAMVNTSGNNWRGIFITTGNGTYNYYIKVVDSLGRVGTAPPGAPAAYYSFVCGPDTIKPVITHTPIGNTPKTNWPATVAATVTDNLGLDSTWVRWKINSGNSKTFKLINTSGNTYTAPFNSTQAEVNIGDTIRYRIIAQDNSSSHNKDSTALYSFRIIGSTYTVSGTVRYSDNNQPVTSGKVKAFKLNKSTMDVIYLDSANIQSDGSYTLNNVPQDSLDIGVFPNSTPPNDWVITYYPSTIYWEQSTTLYPTGNLTNINISAIRLSSTTNNNSVNGKVMRITDTPVSNLKDAFLYAKNGNIFVKCGMTDASGVYHLNSLPVGSLKIIATRLGFRRDSTTVNVTSSSSIDSVNFSLNAISVGIKQINSAIPTECKLYQNYPNPFNPNTIIKFKIKDSRFTALKIFDILGKEVETLVNEKLNQGKYEVNWDGANYPSGIYFYTLRAGEFTETKKMLLIK